MRAARLVAAVTIMCVAVGLAGCVSSPARTSDGARAAVQGTWVLDHDVATAEVPFVAFERDRSWVASDGCDRVYGTWRITAAFRLSVVTGPHAELTCAGRDMVAAALGAETARVPRGSDQLHLAADGETVLLDRSTSDSVGSEDRPIGYWSEDRSASSRYLSLRADDSYRLYDGCSTRTGTWKFSTTEQVRLYPDPASSTTCPGSDSDLGDSMRARVTDTTMRLSTAQGTETGELHRYAR